MASCPITFGGYPIYDSTKFYEECLDIGWPVDWADKANSYTNVSGPHSGIGWLLMRYGDVQQIVGNYTTGYKGDTLVMGDPADSQVILGNPTSNQFVGLYIEDQYVIGGGVGGGTYKDPDSMCLVTIRDGRYMARDMSTDDVSVNIVDGFTNNRIGKVGQLAALTLKVWTDLANQMWGLLNGILGTPNPIIPATGVQPANVPQNFRYSHCDALESIEDFANAIDCTITYDIAGAGGVNGAYAFGLSLIADPNSWTNTTSTKWQQLRDKLLHDDLANKPDLVSVPQAVSVAFPRFNLEDNGPPQGDSQYFLMNVSTGNTINGQSILGTSPGSPTVYDDLVAIFVRETDIVPQNNADIQDRANNRAADYVRRRVFCDRRTFEYSGFQQVVCDGTTQKVRWSHFANDGPKTFVEITGDYFEGRNRRLPESSFYARVMMVEMQTTIPAIQVVGGQSFINGVADTSTAGSAYLLTDGNPGAIAGNLARAPGQNTIAVDGQYLSGAVFGIDPSKTQVRGDFVLVTKMPVTTSVSSSLNGTVAIADTWKIIGRGCVAMHGIYKGKDPATNKDYVLLDMPDARQINVFVNFNGATPPSVGTDIQIVYNTLNKTFDVVNGGGGGSGINYGAATATILAGQRGTFTATDGTGKSFTNVLSPMGIALQSPDPNGNAIVYEIGTMADGTFQVLNPTRLFYAKGQNAAQAGSRASMIIQDGNLGVESPDNGNPLGGTQVSVYCQDGIIAPLRTHRVIVTPENDYEKLEDGIIFSGFCSGDNVVIAIGTFLTVPFQTDGYGIVSALVTKGRVRSGRAYLLGSTNVAGFSSAGTGICLQVIDPDLTIKGTANADIGAGASGVITTNPSGLSITITNTQTVKIPSAGNTVAIWDTDNVSTPWTAVTGGEGT